MNVRAVKLDEDVVIPHGKALLPGDLVVPASAAGLVIFAHGSGSSRHSPRNRTVASGLQRRGIGTLLFDLLTETEEREESPAGELRFNIPLLTERLMTATHWLATQEATHQLSLGYFGASTGAAAALVAAARLEDAIRAVVSRGGRPDLAGEFLAQVRAPTLLIVGGNDEIVMALNQQAQAQMHCRHELTMVPGATHLFEEPGALEEVARRAGDWFVRHFVAEKPVIL